MSRELRTSKPGSSNNRLGLFLQELYVFLLLTLGPVVADDMPRCFGRSVYVFLVLGDAGSVECSKWERQPLGVLALAAPGKRRAANRTEGACDRDRRLVLPDEGRAFSKGVMFREDTPVRAKSRAVGFAAHSAVAVGDSFDFSGDFVLHPAA